MGLRDSFKKGSLEMLVLALLKSGDKYGYEISHLIGERGSNVLAVPEGSLYPTFYRLENEKYISSYKKLVGERRTRVYYHLEPSGEQRLDLLVKEYQIVSQSIQKILTGLVEE
ncbi:MAG: helix-turn-helix transcriptional regulator [Acutalibacter sp.]|nr:helix-turn-helix transcriptional regulator [Acutalibacter sp.]